MAFIDWLVVTSKVWWSHRKQNRRTKNVVEGFNVPGPR